MSGSYIIVTHVGIPIIVEYTKKFLSDVIMNDWHRTICLVKVIKIFVFISREKNATTEEKPQHLRYRFELREERS